VTIAAHDDVGRERLCRHGARPPFSLAKLRVLKDRNVSYLVKKVGRGRAKRRVMGPVEFLGRLSALIPPPRFPILERKKLTRRARPPAAYAASAAEHRGRFGRGP
jgi:hypothetical protein